VFVAQLPDDNHSEESVINASLVYAKQGQVIEEESGSQRLVLSDGTRYHSDAVNGEFQSVAFDRYYIQIQDQEVEQKHRKLSALPTQALFYPTDDKLVAEYGATIQWRIAFPLACIILIFIAVPLSVVNPRQGKFAKMLPALMLFLGYFLLLTSMRSGIERQALPVSVGLWPIHISALFLGVILLMKERRSGKKLKAKLPRFKRNNANKNADKQNENNESGGQA
jgi:lipopolysaccharide export system permease protein